MSNKKALPSASNASNPGSSSFEVKLLSLAITVSLIPSNHEEIFSIDI